MKHNPYKIVKMFEEEIAEYVARLPNSLTVRGHTLAQRSGRTYVTRIDWTMAVLKSELLRRLFHPSTNKQEWSEDDDWLFVELLRQAGFRIKSLNERHGLVTNTSGVRYGLQRETDLFHTE